MKLKVYNYESKENIVIISFFDGGKEDRLRNLGYKTYSVRSGNWEVFKHIDEYLKMCRKIVEENISLGFNKFMLVGICKLSNLALELTLRLTSLYKDIDFIIVGAPFCFDCDKGVSPVCGGNKLSPMLEISWRNIKNRPFLRKYGDARNIACNIDKIKGYQLIFHNKDWDLDIKNFDKLSDKLIHSFRFEVDDDLDHKNTHAYLIHLLKEDLDKGKEIFNRIINLQ